MRALQLLLLLTLTTSIKAQILVMETGQTGQVTTTHATTTVTLNRVC